jgi:hypothetical protein
VGKSLLNPLIIPVFILSGYGYRIMKRVIVDGQPPELPEWDDWGGLIKDGLCIYGAGLIYSLPANQVMLATGVVMLVSAFPVYDSVRLNQGCPFSGSRFPSDSPW